METSILYIEDNEDYIGFVKRAIKKVDESLNLGVVMDGKAALNLIEKNTNSVKLPRLILLDINLPDYNGLEILRRIRSNLHTRYVPVIMFSSSEDQTDMKKALDYGANAYLVKPIGLAPLTEAITNMCKFWLHSHQPVENFAAA